MNRSTYSHGLVSLAAIPAVLNTTDPAVCGESQSLEDLLVSEANRGVANVIVSLVGVLEDVAGRSSRGGAGTRPA